MSLICAVLAVAVFLGGCAGAVLAPLPPVAERPLTDEFGRPLSEAGRSSVVGGVR